MPRVSWLVALGACITLSLPAQETTPPLPASGQSAASVPVQAPKLIPRSHEERERRYEAGHRLILNVRVTDAYGKPVTGLGEDDFTLFDNQQAQKIASFRAVNGDISAATTHVMIVLDTLNDSERTFANDRKEIAKFLRQNQGPLAYPVSIALSTGSGIKAGQPSRNPAALLEELDNIAREDHAFDCADETGVNQAFLSVWMPGSPSTDVSSHKAACLNQRFIRSVSTLNELAQHEVNVHGRLILIWIGSGWPLLSSHEFRPDTKALKQNFFHYLVELSTSLREAQITLDAVSPKDFFHTTQLRSDHDNDYFNGVPSEEEVSAGSLALQVLAHQSGGQILEGSKDVAADLATCISDAESYYVLSFDSAPATSPGEYHPLEVKVNRPGLTLRTNTFYYAQE